jgi:SSS family solute:Na+ symporter
MSTLRSLDLFVIGLYFAAVAWIGFRCARRQNSTEAYFVARRAVPHWAMGLSLFATIISSITFIAYPGSAFQGDWNLLVPGFMAVGVLLLIGPVVVSFFRHAVGMSAYEYFERRFGYSARAYSALAFTASHFSKMGFVLFTITTAVCGMTGWDKYYVITGIGLLTIAYTLIGGLEAVIWTEVLQGMVKLSGLVLVISVLLYRMPGGAASALNLAAEKHKFSVGMWNFDFMRNGNFWVMLLYGFFWYLQKYTADQTLVQRYLVARTDRDALKGIALGASLCVPAWATFMLVGTLLWCYYQLSGESFPAYLYDARGKIISDRVFPYFLANRIPAGIAGVLMAALFSAAMSTMSSDLNCLAVVAVEDYYRRLRPDAPDRRRVAVGKIIVGLCGLIAVGVGIVIAWKSESVLALYYAVTSIVSAGLAGMFLLAFLSRRANKQGLWIGIIAALMFTAWATLTGTKYKMVSLGGWDYKWPEVMIGVIAHVIVLVIGYSASWFFPSDAKTNNEWTLWGWLERRRQSSDKQADPVAKTSPS